MHYQMSDQEARDYDSGDDRQGDELFASLLSRFADGPEVEIYHPDGFLAWVLGGTYEGADAPLDSIETLGLRGVFGP